MADRHATNEPKQLRYKMRCGSFKYEVLFPISPIMTISDTDRRFCGFDEVSITRIVKLMGW